MTYVKLVLGPMTVVGDDILGSEEAAALVRQEAWSSLQRKLMRVVVCERGALRTVPKQLLGPEQNTNLHQQKSQRFERECSGRFG